MSLFVGGADLWRAQMALRRGATIAFVPAEDLIGWFALMLAMFGPLLVGAVALVVSVRRFRAAGARPSILPAISALIIVVALCAGATILGMQFAFAYAWMWAHSERTIGRAASQGDQLGALGIVCAGLLVLGGCCALLHRLVRRNAHSISERQS